MSGLNCGVAYLFRVSAYGDGTVRSADWGAASDELSRSTAACNSAPVFHYRFCISEDAPEEYVVGWVAATDVDHDTLTYSIISGNEDGRFAVSGAGAITVAGALDYHSQGRYTLTVEANDGNGGVKIVPVIIVVTDAVSAQDGAGPISPGAGTGYISVRLWVLLQRYADGETVPQKVTIVINTGTPDFEFGFTAADAEYILWQEEYIGCVGGRKIRAFVWEIPTARVLSVIQRPDVYSAILEDEPGGSPDHPQLNDTLDDIVNAYASGLSAESAAQYALFIRGGSVVVTIRTPGEPAIETLRAWLTARDVHLLPRETEGGGIYGRALAVLLPLEHISTLVAEFATVHLAAADLGGLPLDRSHWPPEAREFENAVVSQYLH